MQLDGKFGKVMSLFENLICGLSTPMIDGLLSLLVNHRFEGTKVDGKESVDDIVSSYDCRQAEKNDWLFVVNQDSRTFQ
jgi:hypothetical protein